MTTPQISLWYVHWLHDYVQQEQGLVPAGQPPTPAADAPGFCSMQAWSRELTEAARVLQDPELGLHFGCTITPQRFGVLGYLLHFCDNLGHAFLRMQQYQRLLFHLEKSVLSTNVAGTSFPDNKVPGDKAPGDRLDGNSGPITTLGWQTGLGKNDYQAETFTLASVLHFSRLLTGQPITPVSVGMMSPPPADYRELQEFLGCPIAFGQSMTSITSPLSLLSLPHVRPDAALRSVLEIQANALLASLPQPDPFMQTLHASIVALLQEGEPTLERTASRLHLSARTLHRRLAERGFRFREVLEQIRYQLAQAWLLDERLSLADVALLLGYSEQSPFTHAFKRWSGKTPFEWRRQQKPR